VSDNQRFNGCLQLIVLLLASYLGFAAAIAALAYFLFW
jgi:hypothetical protein